MGIMYMCEYICVRVFVRGGGNVESVLRNFLESMKITTTQNSNYKREKIIKLRSSLYLRLGSLHSDGK